MLMNRFFILVFFFLFQVSFAQVVTIEKKSDSIESTIQLQKIKSLDNDLFEAQTFKGKDQTKINYRLFKPKQITTQKYPLVIVFHGSGAIGTDNKSQLGVLPKLFASPDVQINYPTYVLAPQFSTRSSDYDMDLNRKVLFSKPRNCLNSVIELIDSLKLSLNIDTKRIYLVGFSMGASTVINSVSKRPNLFAAAISIAGIPEFNNLKNFNSTPIWLIHGVDDTENPIKSDEQFFKEMKNKVKFWKLNGTTHNNVFSTQILGETLPKWLFKNQKK